MMPPVTNPNVEPVCPDLERAFVGKLFSDVENYLNLLKNVENKVNAIDIN